MNSNPAKRVERAVEHARRRVLSSLKKWAALADALDSLSSEYPVATAALKVAAVTGLRISEVLGMEWQHIDMQSGRFHLPHTKTGARDHDLPDAALAILSTLPPVEGNPFVFHSTGGRHVAPRQTGVVFRQAAAAAGVEDARVHDLRRTLATRAAAAGLSAFALRDMLGWKSMAMPARYVQLAGETAREHRRSIGDMPSLADMGGKVVPFRRSGGA